MSSTLKKCTLALAFSLPSPLALAMEKERKGDPLSSVLKNNADETILSRIHRLADSPENTSEIHCQNFLILNTVSEGGFAPLHYAVLHGDAKAVDFLLQAGCMVDSRTSREIQASQTIPNNATPLHIAIIFNKKELVAKLLANGADPNALAEDAITPLRLTYLAKNLTDDDRVTMIEQLIYFGAIALPPMRYTILDLHMALERSNSLIGKAFPNLFLRNVVNGNNYQVHQFLNSSGVRRRELLAQALAIAAAQGHLEIVGTLIDRGAKPTSELIERIKLIANRPHSIREVQERYKHILTLLLENKNKVLLADRKPHLITSRNQMVSS